jgi:hypothetical protein
VSDVAIGSDTLDEHSEDRGILHCVDDLLWMSSPVGQTDGRVETWNDFGVQAEEHSLCRGDCRPGERLDTVPNRGMVWISLFTGLGTELEERHYRWRLDGVCL